MNMTIKTQAFLQGYLHEKTAAEKPRVTPIVAAPGIPQTTPDPGVKPLFQDGKPRFKATQLQMPTTTLDARGRESLTPASVGNQLLTRVPGGPDAFVAEQRLNYEKDRGLKQGVRPSSDLISFDKRNQLVSLDTDNVQRPGHASTYPKERRIVGADPELLRENPKDGFNWGWKPPFNRREDALKDRKKRGDYFGVKGFSNRVGVETLGHELNHNYLGGRDPGDTGYGQPRSATMEPGKSFITDRGSEYTGSATSGLNAMRDVTGEKLNDPQQVHQLFDEIIADPSILTHIAPEHARVFRTYLTLRKTNPEAALELRESMARDSQYLVKNELAGDPTVQKA
jgi:hypothetical protein